jgi:hypothetical protein
MGVNIVNNMFGPHVPAGGVCTGYRFTLHQGDDENVVVNKISPDCTKPERNEIIAAAVVSQSAFNAKIGSVYGTWAGALSGSEKEDLRTCALAY